MGSLTRFLEGKLRLRVNQAKRAVAHVQGRKFLGYRLRREGRFGYSPGQLGAGERRAKPIADFLMDQGVPESAHLMLASLTIDAGVAGA